MNPRPTVDRRLGIVRPEYTGANRCLPCTIVNLVIVLVLVGPLALLSVPLAAVVGTVSLVTIYLRGYLVPGTPALTRRYLPTWVLERLGPHAERIDTSTLDPAVVLIGAGVLLDEPDANDTVVDPTIAERWSTRASDLLRGDERRVLDSLARSITVPNGELTAAREGETVSVSVDGERIARWESPAALCLDVSALEILSETVPDWTRFDVDARGELVAGLRLFVERCPDCGGTVELDSSTVNSCCSTREVVTMACSGCGTRLLELPVDPRTLREGTEPTRE